MLPTMIIDIYDHKGDFSSRYQYVVTFKFFNYYGGINVSTIELKKFKFICFFSAVYIEIKNGSKYVNSLYSMAKDRRNYVSQDNLRSMEE